jgi:hypothetical protein
LSERKPCNTFALRKLSLTWRESPPYTGLRMLRGLIASLLVFSLSGAPLSIGLISASGPLIVDRSPVWGNATVFEGTSVVTAAASGDLALRNGVRIQLAAQSQAVIGENRAILEKGSSQINAATPYAVEARGLRIRGDAGARMRVTLNSSNGVEVTALLGKASVSDLGGLPLAAIPQGRAVAFAMPQQPQPGPAAVTRSGCLLYKDMHFILHDDATDAVIELNGPDLAVNVGKSVQVTGTPTAAKPSVGIATGVMNVANVAPTSTGGCLVVAQTLDALTQVPSAATPPTPASTATAATVAKVGLSGGAIAAIVIGVAAAGGGGAYFALSSSKASTSP